MAATPDLPKEAIELRDILDAVDRDKPTPADIQAMRKALEDYPKLWRAAGDMSHNAATHMINTMEAPESIKLSMRHGWKALQDDLGAADASPLEQLLIQQVVLSWLRLGYVEYAHTSVAMADNTPSIKYLDYWEKRLNATQRRFLRACETLSRIRKLGPAIQVNIAEQQVNVGGS